MITSANKKREISNDPNDNPNYIKHWVEVLAAHTHNPIYMCVYPFDRKEISEPLLHSKLYLDIEFTMADASGNLSDVRFEGEPSAKVFSAFCGSKNFTRTGLGLKRDFTFPEGGVPAPDWSEGKTEQNFEILFEAEDDDAKIALAKAFCFLWNRGERSRYKYCTSEGWTPALVTHGNES